MFARGKRMRILLCMVLTIGLCGSAAGGLAEVPAMDAAVVYTPVVSPDDTDVRAEDGQLPSPPEAFGEMPGGEGGGLDASVWADGQDGGEMPLDTDGAPAPGMSEPIVKGPAWHQVRFLGLYGGKLADIPVRDGQAIGSPGFIPREENLVFQYWYDAAGSSAVPYRFGTQVTHSIDLLPYYLPSNVPAADVMSVEETPAKTQDTGGVPRTQEPSQARTPPTNTAFTTSVTDEAEDVDTDTGDATEAADENAGGSLNDAWMPSEQVDTAAAPQGLATEENAGDEDVRTIDGEQADGGEEPGEAGLPAVPGEPDDGLTADGEPVDPDENDTMADGTDGDTDDEDSLIEEETEEKSDVEPDGDGTDAVLETDTVLETDITPGMEAESSEDVEDDDTSEGETSDEDGQADDTEGLTETGENAEAAEEPQGEAQDATEGTVQEVPEIRPTVEVTYSYKGQLQIGTEVTVRAVVKGLPEGLSLRYQWQNDLGGAYSDVPGATGPQYRFVADAQNTACQWRVSVTLE